MLAIKRSIIVAAIARLLLLYFTLAVIPIDFFHTHNVASITATGGKNFVEHHHVGGNANLSAYCLICNAHFDRTYTLSLISFGQVYLSIIRIPFAEKIIFVAQEAICSITLRGPPCLA